MSFELKRFTCNIGSLTPKIFRIILAVLVLFAIPCSAFCQSFTVFDGLLYKGKPDLSLHGLSPIKIIYAQELWNKNERMDEPNILKISEVAQKTRNNSVVCLDIEHWPVRGNPLSVQKSIEKYNTVANVFRKNNGSSKIGFYSVIPIRDYWRAIAGKSSKKYQDWESENTKLKDIALTLDAIYPSLYTFYPDQKGWEKTAIANIKEAKKYGKPVYVFLWPMYHDGSKYKGQYIPADYWRFQLETCLKYADGVVIWGGWQENWDEYAPWWIETKEFMRRQLLTKHNNKH